MLSSWLLEYNWYILVYSRASGKEQIRHCVHFKIGENPWPIRSRVSVKNFKIWRSFKNIPLQQLAIVSSIFLSDLWTTLEIIKQNINFTFRTQGVLFQIIKLKFRQIQCMNFNPIECVISLQTFPQSYMDTNRSTSSPYFTWQGHVYKGLSFNEF